MKNQVIFPNIICYIIILLFYGSINNNKLFNPLQYINCQSIIPPEFPAVPIRGPYCNTHIYKSCGLPLVFNITAPTPLIGSVGYSPFAISHSLKYDGLLNLRILIPNTNEPSNGQLNNPGNKLGCPILYTTNPYGFAKPYNGNRTAYLYNTADDGTPFNSGNNALLIYRGGSCNFAQRQRAAQELGVRLILMVDSGIQNTGTLAFTINPGITLGMLETLLISRVFLYPATMEVCCIML